MVSVTITQFCGCSVKAATDDVSVNGVAVFQLNFIYKNRGLSSWGPRIVICQSFRPETGESPSFLL